MGCFSSGSALCGLAQNMTQLVLMREREVSQFLVDGLLGRNFSKPLAFFLDRRKEYLRLMARICILSKPREAPACPVLFGEDKKS